MSETARAVTNGQGRVIGGGIDFHNLKTESMNTKSKEVFSKKKSKPTQLKLGELFSLDAFSLIAKHAESLGLHHSEIVEFGRTENIQIKFLDTKQGFQLREHSGRIFTKKEAA